MSSPSDTEKKSGIFGKRAINSSSRADIASSCKIPTANTSPTAQESTKQATRKLSVSKLVDERVRGRVSTKGASSAPNSSRYKESNVGDADDLGSPWRKVNDLIEDLDSSLGDFDKKFKQKEKIGEVLQRKKSAESPPTSDDDFCLAPGSPYNQEDSIQCLLRQIGYMADEFIGSETSVKAIHSMLARLNHQITNNEHLHKLRLIAMKDGQNVKFAEQFVGNKDEILKLELQVDELKKTLKEHEKSKLCDEPLALKNEIAQLKDVIKNYNTEINNLTLKLVEAESYIEQLENGKRSGELEPDEEAIKTHFKFIKRALLSNQNILKLIEAKRCKQR